MKTLLNGSRIVNLSFLFIFIFPPNILAFGLTEVNQIANGDFNGKIVENLSEGWSTKSARPSLEPLFKIIEKRGQRYLYASGEGNPDCAGYVSTFVEIELGKTYWFRVRFRKSKDLNPIHHLLFEVAIPSGSHQIVEFHRLKGDWVEGEAKISFPGKGRVKGEVRILYRLCAKGKLWVQNISLVETEPIKPRWIRVACTQGPGRLEDYGLPVFRKALDIAGKSGVDIVLLPEYLNGEGVRETITGPSVQLMSEKARQYEMYVAGTIGLYDEVSDRLYNAALLFNRKGELIGRYDKIHLYAPELNQEGVTPGKNVPVFQTDFGRIGFMTCADSWFPDVAELAALKGADILLFPNLGYSRSLMPARSIDNVINIVASTRSGHYGVWDSSGNDALTTFTQDLSFPSMKSIVEIQTEEKLGILMVTLNLNIPSNGGSLQNSPRSKRHHGNQSILLEDQIKQEKNRWWIDK